MIEGIPYYAAGAGGFGGGSALAMTPPSNLPIIKSSPNCVICHGQGYEW